MRNSFRFWMQDSTGDTAPPDTAPLFGARLRAWLGSLSARLSTFSGKFPSFWVKVPATPTPEEPAWVRESRKPSTWDDWHAALMLACRETEEALARERAATNRADLLNAAIQYACSMSVDWHATEFLNRWSEGDEEADDELRAWMGSDYGKAVLGETVVGRNGLCSVPPPVGRERPEPTDLQPTRQNTHFTYAPKVPTDVPLHPPPLSRDGMCSGYCHGFKGNWCSRDFTKYGPCKICPEDTALKSRI